MEYQRFVRIVRIVREVIGLVAGFACDSTTLPISDSCQIVLNVALDRHFERIKLRLGKEINTCSPFCAVRAKVTKPHFFQKKSFPVLGTLRRFSTT